MLTVGCIQPSTFHMHTRWKLGLKIMKFCEQTALSRFFFLQNFINQSKFGKIEASSRRKPLLTDKTMTMTCLWQCHSVLIDKMFLCFFQIQYLSADVLPGFRDNITVFFASFLKKLFVSVHQVLSSSRREPESEPHRIAAPLNATQPSAIFRVSARLLIWRPRLKF
jgi:hypothetical protein